MKKLLSKINLSEDAKEGLCMLALFVCVYSVLIGLLAALCGRFDLGFAYIGFLAIAGMITVAAAPKD